MDQIKTYWKTLANEKRARYYDVAAYMIAKALYSKSNEKLEVAKALLLKAYTPITNKTKLYGGQEEWNGLKGSIDYSMWSQIYNILPEDKQDEFTNLVLLLRKEDWNDKTYMYGFVRTDICKVQQAIQLAHVTMVLGQKFGKKIADSRNQHFCIFGLRDENHLKDIANRLAENNIDHVAFYESDIKSHTALATVPLRKSYALRKNLFSQEKMLVID
jgi:hypothetical protein